MKRSVKIVLILVLIILIVVGGFWWLSRRAAEKNGTKAPTFREFFTFTTPVPDPSGSQNGELSSEFTTPGTGGTSGAATPPSESSGGTQFTESTPLTPTTQGGAPGSGGSGTSGSSTGSTGTISGPRTPGSTGTVGGEVTTTTPGRDVPDIIEYPIENTTEVGLQCSVSDTHIRFTEEELRRLQILQQRFNTIASYLHTDGDLAIVEANYDSYKVKDEQLIELAAYCENTLAKIPASDFNVRVPTPFWHRSDLDNQIFGVFFPAGTSAQHQFRLYPGWEDFKDLTGYKSVLEHALGIDIW